MAEATLPPGTAAADAPARSERHAVVVVGGGLGGIAAAIAAVGAGAAVTLLEASEQLGGQITRQAVAPLDEHPLIESVGATATYRRLRDTVRERYRREAPPGALPAAWENPGNGWVSRLCFEPRVGAQALDELLAPSLASQRLTVRLAHQVRAVGRSGARIDHLDVATPDGPVRLDVEVVLDATELGDLLPLAGAPWRTGAEARGDTGEPMAPERADPGQTQAITVCAVLRRDSLPGPVVPRPAGFQRWRAAQPFTLDVPDAQGRPRRFGMFAPGPDGTPPFWTYRRLRDASRLGGDELAVVNFPGNDYVDQDLVGAADREAVAADAGALTRAFVHWLQTEAPRDDGGVGYPELQLDAVAAGSRDGLAPEPYVREARRLRARTIVTAEDVLEDEQRGVRGTAYRDSAGVGWYPLDVHPAVGEPASRNDPTRPFQVPLSALVASAPVNLIAAGKAMGTTHLSNGAYRVHPVEWAVGEAAGALAAHAVAIRRAPAHLPADHRACVAVQRRLLDHGAEVAWVTDLDRADPRWSATQLLAAHGALSGPVLRTQPEAEPDRRLGGDDRAAAVDAFDRVVDAAGEPARLTSARSLGDLAVALAATLPPIRSTSQS